MINKITVVVSIIIVLILGFFVYRKYFILTEIHYHAGFRVFVNGVLQDFSGPEYMALTPCSDTTIYENDQLEKAHLHDRIGYVVHSHREGGKWGDLFANIHYQFDPTKSVVAYLNGKQVTNVLEQTIRPYDSLIILVGRHGDIRQYLQQEVTQAEIKTVERKSEDCGANK